MKDVIVQLDRWIAMKADHPSPDYTQALIDFRAMLLGEGPYAKPDSSSRARE